MSLWAIPHQRNGGRCICGLAVYLTPDGWRDKDGLGRHREPAPRRPPW